MSNPDPDVQSLIDQARTEARDEVLARLRARFVDELLARADAVLGAESTEAVSLVGVVPATSPLDGVDGGRVKALVATIDPNTLDDPKALERYVRAHNDVLLRAQESTPVVPIRFGTVFSRTEDVNAWLERNEAALVDELTRLDGAAEWAVTVSEREPVEPEVVAVGGYLEQRVAVGEAAARRAQLVAERAGPWHERLAAQAETAVRKTGRGVALDAAYLVRARQQRGFDAAILELQEALGEEFELRLTGPWPPFSFVTQSLQ